MKIFGKSLSEYLAFQKLILILVVLVAVARLALSQSGASDAIVRWVSVTAVLLIGIVYYPVRLHASGFGTYRHLLPLLVNQNLLANIIIAVAIVVAIVTGTDNIYSVPEFSGGVDGKTWGHAGAHVVLATLVESLIGWGIASLILLITGKVSGKRAGATA